MQKIVNRNVTPVFPTGSSFGHYLLSEPFYNEEESLQRPGKPQPGIKSREVANSISLKRET